MPADVPASPFLLLLDTLVSRSLDCGVTSSILLDDSSSRGAKLMSSSPHAAKKNAKTNAREILRLHFVALRMTLSFMFLLLPYLFP